MLFGFERSNSHFLDGGDFARTHVYQFFAQLGCRADLLGFRAFGYEAYDHGPIRRSG